MTMVEAIQKFNSRSYSLCVLSTPGEPNIYITATRKQSGRQPVTASIIAANTKDLGRAFDSLYGKLDSLEMVNNKTHDHIIRHSYERARRSDPRRESANLPDLPTFAEREANRPTLSRPVGLQILGADTDPAKGII